MSSIVKKGTNASCFRLANGKVFNFEPDIVTVLNEDDFEQLMGEYGSFIKPRIITESNPSGCFIVCNRKEIAEKQNNELGKVKDNSSIVELKEEKKRTRKAK